MAVSYLKLNNSFTKRTARPTSKKGTTKTTHKEPISYVTSKQIIQTESQKMWHDRLVSRGYTGRYTTNILPTPTPTNCVPDRPYQPTTQSTLDRNVSSENTMYSHLHRIKKQQHAKCVYCPPTTHNTLQHVMCQLGLFEVRGGGSKKGNKW